MMVMGCDDDDGGVSSEYDVQWCDDDGDVNMVRDHNMMMIVMESWYGGDDDGPWYSVDGDGISMW